MAHDVFISYATEDWEVMGAVRARLEEAGIRCWIAPTGITPGDTWSEAIVAAINSSRLLVVVFSTHANSSRHVLREVEAADSKGVPIIPFRIENIPPTGGLQYFLGPQQWLDAFTPPVERHLERLTQSVQDRLKVAPAPTKPSTSIPRYRKTGGAVSRKQLPTQPSFGGSKILSNPVFWTVAVVIVVTTSAGVFSFTPPFLLRSHSQLQLHLQAHHWTRRPVQ